MGKRNKTWLAVLGCSALLILVFLPVGLFIWALNGVDLAGFGLRVSTPVVFEERSAVVKPVPAMGREIGELAVAQENAPNDLAALYEQVNPGTVSIVVGVTQAGQMGAGAGSGFILTDEGYIVTNDHVVQGGDTYIIRFYDGTDLLAELIGVDPDSDLAILQVDELPEGAYPLPLGDYESVRVGDEVVALGNPFGLGTSMSYGIVSGKGRTIPSITQFNIPQAIQTDAAINPGNSGGPLINMGGEVIGVNAQIRTSGAGVNSGVGFAIPVNILRLVYPDLIQSGRYRWAYLGISSPGDVPGFLLPEEMQQAPDGAFIGTITTGGPADEAGLQSGDVVVGVDGQEIGSFEELLTYIAFRQPGDEIELTVWRNGETFQTPLTLGERPSGTVQ